MAEAEARALDEAALKHADCAAPDMCPAYPLHRRCRGCIIRALLLERDITRKLDAIAQELRKLEGQE